MYRFGEDVLSKHKELTFEAINLAFGESNRDLRLSIKASMFSRGMRGIKDCQTLDKLRDCIELDGADVVLCDVGLSGGSFCDLVREIRHGKLGSNPFLLILGSIEHPTPEMVRNVLNAGLDDLLVKPLSLDVIVSRLKNLATARKPFVVTFDYIGPDRRNGKREGEGAPTDLIEVPNPLRSKILGFNTPMGLAREIRSAATMINQYKMARDATQIGYLASRLQDSWRGGASVEELHAIIKQLHKLAASLWERLPGTNFEAAQEQTVSLIAMAAEMLGDPAKPTQERIDQFATLGQSLPTIFKFAGTR